MPAHLLPYDALLEEAKASSRAREAYLRDALPHMWFEAYQLMTPRATNVMAFAHGTFDYIYDNHAQLESMGVVPTDAVSESRLVVAVGLSRPSHVSRRHDDGRLRGWVGPTGATFWTCPMWAARSSAMPRPGTTWSVSRA